MAAIFREFIALARAEPQEMREKVNELLRGKLNTVEEITLTANQASTTITDELVSPNSHISLEATTANAAAEKAAGTMWVSTYGDGTYTVTHANNAQADRTFRVNVTG